MAIFNLYSKRKADAEASGQEDVYQYDDVPKYLRVQIQQIALDALGNVGIPGSSG